MELFQHDRRFLAVRGDKEREELYEDFVVDLVKKVRGPKGPYGYNVVLQ